MINQMINKIYEAKQFLGGEQLQNQNDPIQKAWSRTSKWIAMDTI